jgi:adenosylhomocysteine nucleosidase
MSDLAITDPCILFALRREALFFRRHFRSKVRFPGAPCRAWFGSQPGLSVLMLETGVGTKAVNRALGWALDGPKLGVVTYRPRVVLSAGFSGALQPGLAVGDLVLAREFVNGKGDLISATFPGRLPDDFRVKLRPGRLLTVSELVADPHHKQQLGESSGALAVDMETAEAARLCGQKRLPFGCLRVISDDWHTPLSPQLTWLLRRGRVGPLRLLAALARRPRLAKELWNLAGQTQHAARQLAEGLCELLTLTLDWME